MWSKGAAALAALLALVAACGGGDGGAPTPAGTAVPTPSPTASASVCRAALEVATPQPASLGNQLANPGFEEGAERWFSLTTEAWGRPFEVSQQHARSGASSAWLQLRSEDGGAARVYGAVQELTPGAFPETLSGAYFVEQWEQGTPKQYLQAVVIAFNPSNLPEEVRLQRATNYQLRYILAGVESEPTNISNARYVMVTREPPVLGEWVPFQLNVREDFCELWGTIPEGYVNLRVFFEVRWDGRQETDGVSVADVYYDDLYFGPAAGAP